ncbi:hypothetical protein [uncultured Nocardioides sp.]|uniref:hypothetical protein n=1 Tax=uncultured Nocardioides sp. TaxID=198441 RepID=UPI00263285E6|nr:hypothetical protein [uncultured Nocardioides sp.]
MAIIGFLRPAAVVAAALVMSMSLLVQPASAADRYAPTSTDSDSARVVEGRATGRQLANTNVTRAQYLVRTTRGGKKRMFIAKLKIANLRPYQSGQATRTGVYIYNFKGFNQNFQFSNSQNQSSCPSARLANYQRLNLVVIKMRVNCIFSGPTLIQVSREIFAPRGSTVDSTRQVRWTIRRN